MKFTPNESPIIQFILDNGIEGVMLPVDFQTSAINNAIYNSLNPLFINE